MIKRNKVITYNGIQLIPMYNNVICLFHIVYILKKEQKEKKNKHMYQINQHKSHLKDIHVVNAKKIIICIDTKTFIQCA